MRQSTGFYRGVSMDALEALANATVGLVVSWAATWLLLPLWGLHPSASASVGITMCFFGLSFTRAWALRILFRRLANV